MVWFLNHKKYKIAVMTGTTILPKRTFTWFSFIANELYYGFFWPVCWWRKQTNFVFFLLFS